MYESGGTPGAKVANPDYNYYPGYGNHKTEGVETLPAGRCVQVTLNRLRTHASDCINAFHFLSTPDKLGDDMPTYKDEAAYIAYIDSVPESLDADEEEEAADPTWRAQVEERLQRIEAKLKLTALDKKA